MWLNLIAEFMIKVRGSQGNQSASIKKGRKHNAYGLLVRNLEYIVVQKTLNAQAVIGGGRI